MFLLLLSFLTDTYLYCLQIPFSRKPMSITPLINFFSFSFAYSKRSVPILMRSVFLFLTSRIDISTLPANVLYILSASSSCQKRKLSDATWMLTDAFSRHLPSLWLCFSLKRRTYSLWFVAVTIIFMKIFYNKRRRSVHIYICQNKIAWETRTTTSRYVG